MIFYLSQIFGNHQMYEILDDTAVQLVLAIKSGDSIRVSPNNSTRSTRRSDRP
jgi:hypothetical protein